MKYKLSVELNKYAKSLDNKLEEIVNQTLDYTYKELIDAMPVRSGVYRESHEKNIIQALGQLTAPKVGVGEGALPDGLHPSGMMHDHR